MTLHESDYANLESSCISRELADDAGITRVDTFEGARLVGREARAGVDYSGLAFPYFWPGIPNIRDWRIRRDNPDLALQIDGELKEQAKYLGPPRVKSMLYFPPGIDPAWLEDVSMPVVFVEGEKKCLALWMLACLFARDGRPLFLPIAIPGVWNFQTRRADRVPTPNGGHKDVKGPISDLGRVTWHGRTVTILFDSNIHWNEGIQAARIRFAYWLREWGAEVLFAELPADCGVNGPDDYMAECGSDALLKILESARPGTYGEARNAQEHFAISDHAQMEDLFMLMTARWGWSEEDRETWRAYNGLWGGRRHEGFPYRSS